MKQIKKQKRRKISIINILITLFIFSLLFLILFKNKQNIQKILTKTKKQKSLQEYTSNDLQIGDIVYYNHKIPEDYKNENKLKVTYEKGSAENPGMGKDGTQTFDSREHKALWKVWDIKPNGEVVLVSDNEINLLNAKGAIGYIWYEHNIHKGASTFGYGYGANTEKEFTYKVGSGLADTYDTNIWKTGTNGISKSGTRAINLIDIESKLEINIEKIKSGYNNIYTLSEIEYGGISNLNISFPQRKVSGLKQNWDDEGKAKSSKQNIRAKNGDYYWKWQDVPNSKYKELIKGNADYFIATTMLRANKSDVYFYHAYSDNFALSSSYYGFVISKSNGQWGEAVRYIKPRFLTFLRPDISYYKVTDEENAWDIMKVESKPKDIKIKATNLTKKDEKIKINLSSELNGKDIIKNPNIDEINIPKNNNFSKDVSVQIYSGQIRTGKQIDAEYKEVHNKYKVEISGLSTDSTYKVIGMDTNGYIDLEKTNGIEVIIYPKDGAYSVPVEYIGGENDTSFSVLGNAKLMKNGIVVKTLENINLKRGVAKITFPDVAMFDNITNKLNEYTVVFEKNGNSHKVEVVDGKISVKYVPEKIDISVQVKSEGNITLDSVTVELFKKVSGKEELVQEIELLKRANFLKNIKLDKTDKTGNKIEYIIKKKSLNIGYVTTINGFQVNLKPVIKLPITGGKLDYKTICIMSGTIIALAVIFGYRRKKVLIFKEYNIMK